MDTHTTVLHSSQLGLAGIPYLSATLEVVCVQTLHSWPALCFGSGRHIDVGGLWGQGGQTAASQVSMASCCRVYVKFHAHSGSHQHCISWSVLLAFCLKAAALLFRLLFSTVMQHCYSALLLCGNVRHSTFLPHTHGHLHTWTLHWTMPQSLWQVLHTECWQGWLASAEDFHTVCVVCVRACVMQGPEYLEVDATVSCVDGSEVEEVNAPG